MKNIKPVIIFLLIAFALIGAIVFGANYFSTTKQDSTPTDYSYETPIEESPTVENTQEPTPTTAVPTKTSPSYTLAEVQAHASASSCWTIIRDSVYDVTTWIKEHPGGSGAILQTCGKDATAAFEGQHDGQKRPESELAGFKIGAYKK